MRSLARTIIAAATLAIGLNPALSEEGDIAAFEKTDREKTVSAFAFALFIQYEQHFREFLVRQQQLSICDEKDLLEALSRQYPTVSEFYSDPGVKNLALKEQASIFFSRYGEPITEIEYSAALNVMDGMLMGYFWGNSHVFFKIKAEAPEEFCSFVKNEFADTYKKASNWKDALSKQAD